MINAERQRATLVAASAREYAARKIKYPWCVSLHNAQCRANRYPHPHEFDLTHAWARARWTGACELSGLPFKQGRQLGMRGPGPFAPSIDRIDRSLGYVQGNCRFILHAINNMRGEGSDADVRTIVRALWLAGQN